MREALGGLCVPHRGDSGTLRVVVLARLGVNAQISKRTFKQVVVVERGDPNIRIVASPRSNLTREWTGIKVIGAPTAEDVAIHKFHELRIATGKRPCRSRHA